MSPLELKAEVSKPEGCKVSVEIEIPVKEVKQRADMIFAQIQKSAVLDGFRQGKVPAEMVRKNFANIARDEMLQKLIPEAVEQVAHEHNLRAIGETEVDALDFDFDKELKFKASFEVKPEITLKEYKNLSLEKEILEVGDKEVNLALEHLRERAAQLVVAGHDTVKKDDFVVVDYEIFSEGKPVPEGKVQDQVALVKDDQLLPKFAEQLVGLKKGEAKDIVVQMPADFNKKELAGKEAIFKLVLKEIKEKKLPELNDDFVKEIGENITLQELKDKIKKNIEAQEESRIKREVEAQIVDKLVAGHDFCLPNVLVERQIEYLVDKQKEFIERQGSTTEALGLTDEIMRAKVKHDAERQVKAYLLLEAIGKQEKLAVSDEDLKAEMGKTMAQSKQPAEQVQEFFTKYHDQIVSQMEEDKAYKFLLDNAKVKEVKASKKHKEHDHAHDHNVEVVK